MRNVFRFCPRQGKNDCNYYNHIIKDDDGDGKMQMQLSENRRMVQGGSRSSFRITPELNAEI